MARSKRGNPTERAAAVVKPEQDAVERETGMAVGKNLIGAPTAMMAGAAAGAKALGRSMGNVPGGVLGKMAGTAALGSVVIPAVGGYMAQDRLDKARASIAKDLPRIDAAKAKNAESRARRK
jgi:hypothetical protein